MIKKRWFKAQDDLKKYQLLLENSQEILLLFDMAGRITDCSVKAKEELNYGDDILQLPISCIFKEAFSYEDYHIKIDERFLDANSETVAYRKNQTCFPVSLKVKVNYAGSSYTGVCTAVSIEEKIQISRDMDDLRRELHNTNQISSELVAKVAHELRTPLNGIMGFTASLLDTELSPDQCEAVSIISKCSDNLNTLINDLTDYTLMLNDKLIIEAVEFKFFDFIRHIVDMNIGSINEKGLKLLVYVSNDIPDRLIGDEIRLTQVLNNLFSNAIKFTQSGQISFEVMKLVQTELDIELLFMVIDTGIGIKRDDKDKLFQSFSQIDSSITRNYGGTGLGLSICKNLVETMNGSISVDSEINKGSKFSFTVRLILPKNHDSSKEDKLKSESNAKDDISELDYVNKKLQKIEHTEIQHINGISSEDDININSFIENLSICIAMENWEMAEMITSRMKGFVTICKNINSKMILRLLFAIRRENQDLSLSILNEIKINVSREEIL